MDRKEAIERIKRHMVILQMGEYPHIKIGEALSLAIEALQEPERKKGQWIEKSKWQSRRWVKWFECSICGEKDYNVEMYEDMPFTGLPDFCPNCGADMRGEEE